MGDRSAEYGVGMQTFGIWEAAEGGRFDLAVFYPAYAGGRELIREDWRLQAGEGARPLPGFYPLILLSHDISSSRFANSDVATALARGGFIVIAPSHAGDSQNDSGLIHTAAMLSARPRQLLMALETVLASPVLAPYADESRIGLLGIGFGGVTALQLAGARPLPEGMTAHCPRVGKRPNAFPDPFCTPWALSRLARLPSEAAALEKSLGPRSFTPPLDLYAPVLEAVPPGFLEEGRLTAQPASSIWTSLLAFFAFSEEPPASAAMPPAAVSSGNGTAALDAALDFHGGPLFGNTDSGLPFVRLLPSFYSASPAEEDSEEPLPPPRAAADAPVVHRRPAALRRIQALALVLPAGGMFFPPEGMAGVQAPILVLDALEDGLYDPDLHARPYVLRFSSRAEEVRLAGADHFSLFASCSQDIREELRAACGRMREEDRLEVRRMRDAELLAFFRSSLGVPREVPPPSGLRAAPVSP